jgi:hypothetical protein
MIDFGYDVAAYCDVDPRFGSWPISTIFLLNLMADRYLNLYRSILG